MKKLILLSTIITLFGCSFDINAMTRRKMKKKIINQKIDLNLLIIRVKEYIKNHDYIEINPYDLERACRNVAEKLRKKNISTLDSINQKELNALLKKELTKQDKKALYLPLSCLCGCLICCLFCAHFLHDDMC